MYICPYYYLDPLSILLPSASRYARWYVFAWRLGGRFCQLGRVLNHDWDVLGYDFEMNEVREHLLGL